MRTSERQRTLKEKETGHGQEFPRPNGELQGDDRAMPDRGTRTGFQGDNYGADVSQSATNRLGSLKGSSQSHAPDKRPGKNNQGC